jgi:hypothetical protein
VGGLLPSDESLCDPGERRLSAVFWWLVGLSGLRLARYERELQHLQVYTRVLGFRHDCFPLVSCCSGNGFSHVYL